MQVKVESEGPCRRLVQIDVPVEDVAAEWQTVVKQYTKHAKIKGFRPGRAPVPLVEKIYFKSIQDDVKDRMLPRCYREAVEREALAEIAPVDVRDVALDKASGLKFKVLVDVAPEFKLPKYAKLSLKSNPVDVPATQVDEAIQSIRESQARFEDVAEARPVGKGDLVCMDYAGTIDGAPVKALVPDYPGLAEGKDFWALIADPELLPGLNDGLMGCLPEETRTLTLTFPDDYRVSDLAGKTAQYTVTPKKIRDRILPAIDEAFLKQFDTQTEEELRKKIHDDLTARAEQAEQQRMKDEIAKQLLEKTKCDLPQSQVEEETRRAARAMVRQIAQQGGGNEVIEKQKDQIMAAAYQSSADRVKLTYILERIAAEEGITVDDETVNREVTGLARQYGLTPAKFREQMGDDGLKRMRSDMLCSKTLDFLLENAKIKS